MHWKLVTPFLRTKDQWWIQDCIQSPNHSFDIITADYAHDRSRKNTSGREWLDYLWQAIRASAAGLRSRRRPVGFITAFPPNAVCMGLVQRLTGSQAPIVAWAFNLSRKYDGRKQQLARFALAKVNVFVVFSKREITTYSDMLGLPTNRFVYVPFTEEMVEPEFNEDEQEPFVLAMGTANRDYATMIEAVAALGLRTIIIAGARAVDGISLPPNVTVRSGLTLAACHELCQKARVNVIPLDTIDTASGQVTVRYAMMFGKAAIATTSIGTEDYIEDGVTGLLVPPKDAAAMAAAIKQLWDDPARRQAMGDAARTWLLEHAAFEVGPARLRDILESIRLGNPTLAPAQGVTPSLAP